MDAKTNGQLPAHPTSDREDYYGNKIYAADGLTKREEFAKAAMEGLMASYAGLECRMGSPEDIARDACVRADALLAALAKDGE